MNLSQKAIDTATRALAGLSGLQYEGMFPATRKKYERHATAVLAAAGPTLVADQLAIISQVDSLHTPIVMPKLGGRHGATENRCKSCTYQSWPCETRRAIDRANT